MHRLIIQQILLVGLELQTRFPGRRLLMQRVALARALLIRAMVQTVPLILAMAALESQITKLRATVALAS
jgi:hypothetical protein